MDADAEASQRMFANPPPPSLTIVAVQPSRILGDTSNVAEFKWQVPRLEKSAW